MPIEWIIRKLEPRDEYAVKEICKISFGKIYRYFAIQSLSSVGDVLVCEADNVIAGFAKLTQNHIGNHAVGDILWLAVSPQFRKRSVASTLISAGVNNFRNNGITCIYVSTRKNNKPALALFQKNGFRKIGFFKLMKRYGLRVFKFYSEFWIAPTEVVLEREETAMSS